MPPPDTRTLVVPNLKQLLTIRGEYKGLPASAPPTRAVCNITIKGIGFRDGAPTFLEPHGIPSGGDWSLQRTAAVFLEGTEEIAIESARFKYLGVQPLPTLSTTAPTFCFGWVFQQKGSGEGFGILILLLQVGSPTKSLATIGMRPCPTASLPTSYKDPQSAMSRAICDIIYHPSIIHFRTNSRLLVSGGLGHDRLGIHKLERPAGPGWDGDRWHQWKSASWDADPAQYVPRARNGGAAVQLLVPGQDAGEPCRGELILQRTPGPYQHEVSFGPPCVFSFTYDVTRTLALGSPANFSFTDDVKCTPACVAAAMALAGAP